MKTRRGFPSSYIPPIESSRPSFYYFLLVTKMRKFHVYTHVLSFSSASPNTRRECMHAAKRGGGGYTAGCSLEPLGHSADDTDVIVFVSARGEPADVSRVHSRDLFDVLIELVERSDDKTKKSTRGWRGPSPICPLVAIALYTSTSSH